MNMCSVRIVSHALGPLRDNGDDDGDFDDEDDGDDDWAWPRPWLSQ